MEQRIGATPGRWIRMGWNVFTEDVGNLVLITLITLALTSVGSVVVAGPLFAGLFYVMRQRILYGRSELMDMFQGFNLFIDSLLIWLLVSVFQFVGLILCVFPILIVTAFYLFPYMFLVDRKLSFWDAMEASRKVVSRELGGFVIFVLLLALLNLLGLLLLGVGLLVTIPVSVAAITVAYKEIVGFEAVPIEPSGPVNIP